jgi:hypothetical protein
MDIAEITLHDHSTWQFYLKDSDDELYGYPYSYSTSPFSDYKIQTYISELEHRISHLANNTATRVGMDENYPIDREIHFLNKELEIAKKFERHGLNGSSEVS